MLGYAPNRNVCTGLQYTHAHMQFVSEKDGCMSRSVALQLDLSCNSKPHKEMSPIVEQSCDMQNVFILPVIFKLCIPIACMHILQAALR